MDDENGFDTEPETEKLICVAARTRRVKNHAATAGGGPRPSAATNDEEGEP